ncbi:L,D-transpeptidase family protein [Lysobacter humi (ex Lee et al. 2017)]
MKTTLAKTDPYAALRRTALHLAAATALALGTVGIARADDDAPAAVEAARDLRPGQYEWTPEVSATGPVVVVVSLPEQMAHVYRGGVRIGRSTISSGKPGHETPPGVYPILQKRERHFSNKYNNAPMPYMQRLTWDGIALHAGAIPGRPASHGCVRLPLEFAKALFQVTDLDMTVVVADETTHSARVLSPGDTVPVDWVTGREMGDDLRPVAAAGNAAEAVAAHVDAR